MNLNSAQALFAERQKAPPGIYLGNLLWQCASSRVASVCSHHPPELLVSLDPNVEDAEASFLLRAHFPDIEHMPAEWEYRPAVAAVVAVLRAGKRALVACHAGVNRSGLICALVIREMKDIPGAAALAMVEEGRFPLTNETFRKFLRGLT